MGYGASVNASNKIVVGNTAITSIGGQVGWTTFSDIRLKQNIQPSTLGLEFINQLKPVTYEYKAEGQAGIRYTGLIAQEVEEAAKGTFSGVDKTGEYMGIRYAELAMPLINAVQTLSKENETLKKEYQDLAAAFNTLQKTVEQYGQDLRACCLSYTDNAAQTITPTSISNWDMPSLEQNVPNPFNQTTSIQYYLPSNVQNATLQITDATGKLIETIALTQRGVNNLTLQAQHYSQGTYFYTLWIDGKLVLTKKMQLF